MQTLSSKLTHISETYEVPKELLLELVGTVTNKLSLGEVKSAVQQTFNVDSTPELKKSEDFQALTANMGALPLNCRESWLKLYRKFVGVLPEEYGDLTSHHINGVDIFKYFKPWQVFGLDRQTATADDIRKAYHALSRRYHPDSPHGDREIFERLNTLYRSLKL